MAGKVQYNGQWTTHADVRRLKGIEIPVPAKKASPKAPAEAAAPLADISAESEMEALRSAFEAKFGQPVGNRYKNDAEWISAKLNS